MHTLVKGEVSNKIADLLSSTTLVVLLKKDAEAMAQLKLPQCEAYRQPQRPLGIGSKLVKVISNCVLLLLKGYLGPTAGPTKFSVETKGGCDQVLWTLQMAMDADGMLFAACLDAINTFGEIDRECIRAALCSDVLCICICIYICICLCSMYPFGSYSDV